MLSHKQYISFGPTSHHDAEASYFLANSVLT